MTLQCAILLFQLRKGGYISKGIFCSIFIKVKEISKEQPSLKVIFFTVIFKPRLKNQSIYVSTEITDLKKNTYCICHQLELCARQKYVHFLETNLKITFEIQAPLLSWSLLRPTWSFWTNLSNKSGRVLIWKSGSKLFSISKFNEFFYQSQLWTQCARTDLNKRFLPKPMPTTEWKGTS